jgi:hypothetical protein
MIEPQRAVARALLGPVLALVGLAYVTAAAILVTRLGDMLFRGQQPHFYEDYAGGGPPAVQRTTSQLANQFEFPVLFLAGACLAVACGINDGVLQGLAWAYVVLRWLHAIIRVTGRLNRLWLRTPVFMLSNFVLLAVWVQLARRIGAG